MILSVKGGFSLQGQIGRSLAFLDPEVMRAQHIAADEVIKIQSCHGKFLLARVAALPAEEAGKGGVYLDHYLRRTIKVAPGEKVQIEKIATGAVKRVFFSPLTDISSLVGITKEHLKRTLITESIPVCLGSIVSIPLSNSSTGAILKVSNIDPGPGLVTTQTEVELVSPKNPESSAQAHGHQHEPITVSGVTFEDVGGLSKEIAVIRELIEVPLRFPQVYTHLGIRLPRGIIFHGPAGVGKTHLSLAVANEMDAELFYINGPEIVSTEFGETESNLRRVFKEASNHRPAIIVIDELDAIAPKRSETGSFTTTRTVSHLLSLLDGLKKTDGITVIGTTNSLDSIDTAARRPGRFDREIFLSPPDATSRLEILRIHSRAMPIDEEVVGYLEEVAQKAIGFVGADLMELCREAGLNAFRRRFGDGTNYRGSLLTSLEGLTVERLDFDFALSKIRPSALREVRVTTSDIGWDDVGGLEEVKEQLRELVQMPLLHPEALASMRIRPPSGVLLYGEPGTGKTMLARALARECHANFISVKGSEIFSKWLGESEAEIRSIFQLAYRVTPTIIFFDHIDAIALRRRGDATTQAAERVVSQLLSEMDSIPSGSGIVVVAATNRIDLIDPALLQANRFGTHIFIPLPDEATREMILRIYLKGVPFDKQGGLEELLEMMGAETDGFSGADLESLCHRAKMLALRNGGFEKSVLVKLEHFKEALMRIKESRYKSAS